MTGSTPPSTPYPIPSSQASGQARPPHRVETPLRFRALARKDPAAAVRAMDLDRRLQAVARATDAAKNVFDRAMLHRQMVELRVELDALVAVTLGAPLPSGSEPSALSLVPAAVRHGLAALLGVPLRPEFHPILERKAAEWLEQGRVFDEVSTEFGFVDASALSVCESRGALVLTHNGSLVQVSAPKDDVGTRKFVYQSIYVNPVPTEGSLSLREPARIESRMKTTAFETSSIRKLRVPARAGGAWERERKTFARISAILTPMPVTSTPLSEPKLRVTQWGAATGFVPSFSASAVDASRQAREVGRLDEGRLAARVELAALLQKLSGPGARHATTDVDVLGLVMHLQELEHERGRTAWGVEQLAEVTTDRDERLVIGESIRLVRAGRSERTFPRSALGAQRLAIGAPIVLLDDAAAIAAVLGDVAAIVSR